MKKFFDFTARLLVQQEILLRGILVFLFTFILFAYYIVMIPFLHIYKFLKSGLETMDETQSQMVKSMQALYEELYGGQQ